MMVVRWAGRWLAGCDWWKSAGSAVGSNARTTGARSYDRDYKATVSIAGRRASTRWINASVSVRRAKRIFWETDAYVNYCINRSRPVYSSGGRLYCVRPRKVSRSVSISKRRN